MWSVGGMIVTGKDTSTGRKTHASATLSTANPTHTGLAMASNTAIFMTVKSRFG